MAFLATKGTKGQLEVTRLRTGSCGEEAGKLAQSGIFQLINDGLGRRVETGHTSYVIFYVSLEGEDLFKTLNFCIGQFPK